MFRRIAHRANTDGPSGDEENKVFKIAYALSLGLDVEVDLLLSDDKLYLGHDTPQELFHIVDLAPFRKRIWLHCKNVETLVYVSKYLNEWNYFYHDQDLATITSKGILWFHPDAQPAKNGVLVHPEQFRGDPNLYTGICTDYPLSI